MNTNLEIMIYGGIIIYWILALFAVLAPKLKGYRVGFYLGVTLVPLFISDARQLLNLYFGIGGNRDPSSEMWVAIVFPIVLAGLLYIYIRKLKRIPATDVLPSRAENGVYFMLLLVIIYQVLISMVPQVTRIYKTGDVFTFSIMLYWIMFWLVIVSLLVWQWRHTGRLAPSPATGVWEKVRSFSLGFASFLVLVYIGLYLAPFVIMIFTDIPSDASFLLRFSRGLGLQWLAWGIWLPLILFEVTRWFPYVSREEERNSANILGAP